MDPGTKQAGTYYKLTLIGAYLVLESVSAQERNQGDKSFMFSTHEPGHNRTNWRSGSNVLLTNLLSSASNDGGRE